jgi:hypothetical protein
MSAQAAGRAKASQTVASEHHGSSGSGQRKAAGEGCSHLRPSGLPPPRPGAASRGWRRSGAAAGPDWTGAGCVPAGRQQGDESGTGQEQG